MRQNWIVASGRKGAHNHVRLYGDDLTLCGAGRSMLVVGPAGTSPVTCPKCLRLYAKPLGLPTPSRAQEGPTDANR